MVWLMEPILEFSKRIGLIDVLLQKVWTDQWYMDNVWKNLDKGQPRPCISDQTTWGPNEVQSSGHKDWDEWGKWTDKSG